MKVLVEKNGAICTIIMNRPDNRKVKLGDIPYMCPATSGREGSTVK